MKPPPRHARNNSKNETQMSAQYIALKHDSDKVRERIVEKYQRQAVNIKNDDGYKLVLRFSGLSNNKLFANMPSSYSLKIDFKKMNAVRKEQVLGIEKQSPPSVIENGKVRQDEP